MMQQPTRSNCRRRVVRESGWRDSLNETPGCNRGNNQMNQQCTTKNLCPRDTLKSMLEQPAESPNPTMAFLIIGNCQACRKHFSGDTVTTITVICAWCGKPLGTKDGDGQTGVSHGICHDCHETLISEFTTSYAKQPIDGAIIPSMMES